MKSSIRNHGNLLAIAKAEAERWGWKVETENLDVDPLDYAFGLPKPWPGRGDVNLIPPVDGDVITFEYELPEYEEDIVATVRSIISGDNKTRDRLSDPDEFNRPLEV